MNDKTDRASEIMKQMEFVEQLTQKLNRAIYLGAQTAIGYRGMCGHTQVQSDIKRLRCELLCRLREIMPERGWTK